MRDAFRRGTTLHYILCGAIDGVDVLLAELNKPMICLLTLLFTEPCRWRLNGLSG